MPSPIRTDNDDCSAQLSNAVFAAQTRNHDPDLLGGVARRISRTAFSASSECRSTFDLISAPCARWCRSTGGKAFKHH